MANRKNLKPPINKRTTEEQREITRKGGIKSGEVRRERKKLKELLELALQVQDESTGEQNDFTIIKSLIKRAKDGDVKAFEVIRDTVGEKPTDKVENINPTTIINNTQLDFDKLKELKDKMK